MNIWWSLEVIRGPKMPIHKSWVDIDSKGREYKVDVMINTSHDLIKYLDGIKCVFRALREKQAGTGEFQLVLLVDNHDPFGYHFHDKLPGQHNSRKSISAKNWKEAWHAFKTKLERIYYE